MIKLILTVILTTLQNVVLAQIVAFAQDEELRDAVEYQLSNKQEKFDTLRTFRVGKQILEIATTYSNDQTESYDLRCYIIRPLPGKRYQQIFIDSQGVEGGPAELETIFSANVNSDRSLEIIVLYRWHISHYMTGGYIYEVRCYKNFDSNSTRLLPLLNQPKIDCGFEGVLDGKTVHARYNTEAKIRRRLKQLGYKQYSK
jgi:hypothetical protein